MREEDVRFLILVFVCLVAALFVLILLFWGLRRLKRSLKDSSSLGSGSGWTIEQINELHESGRLTDKQYRSLRDAVIRSSDRPAPGSRHRR
ncbi:MAG: hypothetical protein GWP14_09455 [Actinobacteria bacterium]|nr:hypothetical protein [Actinomycetota bacterium]